MSDSDNSDSDSSDHSMALQFKLKITSEKITFMNNRLGWGGPWLPPLPVR